MGGSDGIESNKRQKASDGADQQQQRLQDLSSFKLQRVLSEDPRTKHVALLGTFEGSEGDAIVLLSRRHFPLQQLPAMLQCTRDMQLAFHNDIYSKYGASVPKEFSDITVDLIHPATEKHIAKHSKQQHIMVTETSELYRIAVLPYINAIPAARLQWVYNILDKTAERERLLHEDPDSQIGFMLHPDLKWDQIQVEQLYCIVLVHRRDIRSLRDINADHLPLLRNIRSQVATTIRDRFGVAEHLLRFYVHYQPSYYHFHVHVSHVSFDGGAGVAVGKAHLLSDIINNVELVPDYYQKRTLFYSIGENDALLAAIRR